MHKLKRPFSLEVLSFTMLAVLSSAMLGCGRTQAAAPPRPPEVTVAPVVQQDVPVYSEWITTLDGYVNAQVRPQVSGYIIRQNYTEGSLVRRGDVLFEIDPRPFQAALDRAKGDLAQAQAQLGKSILDVERDTPLVEAKAIAKSQLDNEAQARLGAQALIESDKADVEQAELAAARKRPEIGPISTSFLPRVPQKFLEVDREKVLKQGVAISDVYRTIQAFMGGLFINYFNDFGRTWQVYVEAEAPYRSNMENLGQFYVRNNAGQRVPLSALTNFEPRSGPEFTMRYNEYRSAQINGSAAPGYSSDQATAALEDVFKQTMPGEMGFDYMGMSYQEQKARQGLSASVIFGFSLLFVFLILAALYESWSLPFSVLLSTPVAVFGAFGILWLRRTVLGALYPAYMVQIENDVYSQIGLVMLIGLAAKNAILIV